MRKARVVEARSSRQVRKRSRTSAVGRFCASGVPQRTAGAADTVRLSDHRDLDSSDGEGMLDTEVGGAEAEEEVCCVAGHGPATAHASRGAEAREAGSRPAREVSAELGKGPSPDASTEENQSMVARESSEVELDPTVEALLQAEAVPREEEPFSTILEATVPALPYQTIFAELTAPVWNEKTMYIEELMGSGATDINIGEPMCPSDCNSDSSITVLERVLRFTIPVPPTPMCPKTTTVTTLVRITVFEGPCPRLLIETATRTHDVPFGLAFVVQGHSELAWNPDLETCIATKMARLVFLQRVGWFKPIISNNVMTGQVKNGEDLLMVLRKRAEPVIRTRAVSIGPGPSLCSVQRGMCFEVQRRLTGFSQWRVPFFPFDGDKKWRWVDVCYGKHHWMPEGVDRKVVSEASMPPFNAGGGWEQRDTNGWETDFHARNRGEADEDGWQYAMDFSVGGNFWSKSSRGRLCRRRLWICDFRESVVMIDEV